MRDRLGGQASKRNIEVAQGCALINWPDSADEAVAVTKEVFPDGAPRWITLLSGPKGVYKVRMRRADENLYE